MLFNVGGWLVFGVAMMIGSLDVMPWDVILATESVYVVTGFVLAMLLGRVYDRLGIGRLPNDTTRKRMTYASASTSRSSAACFRLSRRVGVFFTTAGRARRNRT